MADLDTEQTLTALTTNLFVGSAVACAVTRRSRSQVLRMAKNGTLPAVFSGNRIMFPTAPLLRMLGREDLLPVPTTAAPADVASAGREVVATVTATPAHHGNDALDDTADGAL